MGRKHKKHSKEKENEDGVPLKLVLKVGSGGTPASTDTPGSDYDDKKHKHKKKKKKKDRHRDREKRKHDTDDIDTQDDDEEDMEPMAKRALFEAEQQLAMDGAGNETPPPPPSQGLIRLLTMQHVSLQKKDVNSFFAFPVSDLIAPGYSDKIKCPMDMSAMKIKVENGQYRCVADYLDDFKLMCDNCTIYNRPETIFYKEAKRMYAIASRQLMKEKLLLMRAGNPLLSSVTAQELGVEESDLRESEMKPVVEVEKLNIPSTTTTVSLSSTTPSTPNTRQRAKVKLGAWEYDMDDEEEITAEVILAQAKAAAAGAAEQLTLRSANSKFGFLRRQDDGSTTLNILNPDNTGYVDDRSRVVDLGTLTGKIQNGVGNIAGFREDKRNKVTPVSALNYGPFSAYAPCYDSTFANITKEQSDMLLTTYGDEIGLEYAKSINAFASSTCDYAIEVVDSLLDMLTDGKHTESVAELRKKDIEDAQVDAATQMMDPDHSTADTSSIATDITEGVNMDFLQGSNQESIDPKTTEKLDKTADLIGQLQKTQYERLSQPVQHLSQVAQPSEQEKQLAGDVSKGLTDMIKGVAPGYVVSAEGVRSAMGITTDLEHTQVLQDSGNVTQYVQQTDTQGQVITQQVDTFDQQNNMIITTQQVIQQPDLTQTQQVVTEQGIVIGTDTTIPIVANQSAPMVTNQTVSMVAGQTVSMTGVEQTAPTFSVAQSSGQIQDEAAAAVAALGGDSNTQYVTDNTAQNTQQQHLVTNQANAGGDFNGGNLPSELAEFFQTDSTLS